MINIKDFSKLELRVGTIVKAEILQQAKVPAYRLEIDFGKLGMKQSSAQITDYYQPKDLVGRQIIGITNLSPKKVAGFTSEVLVLGANNVEKAVVLLATEEPIPNGSKVS